MILVGAVNCQLSHVLLTLTSLPPKENCYRAHAAKYWMSEVEEENEGGRLSKDELARKKCCYEAGFSQGSLLRLVGLTNDCEDEMSDGV